MDSGNVLVELYGIARARFDTRGAPAAEKFIRTHYHRYIVDALSSEPNILVQFGPVPQTAPGADSRHKVLARWRTRVAGLTADPIRVWVDANRFGAMFFIGCVFSTLVKEVFLRHGFAAVHAAALAGSDRGVLLPGEQGTGKTLMAFVFLKHGYRLLGDDTVYLGPGGRILGSLFPVTVRHGRGLEELVSLGRADRFRLALRRLVSVLTAGYYQLMTIVPPQRLAPDSLADKASLTDVCYLGLGDAFQDLGPMSRDQMIDLLLANEQAANPDANAMIERASAGDPDASLARFWPRYRRALQEAVGRQVRCRRAAVPRRFSREEFEKVVRLIETAS